MVELGKTRQDLGFPWFLQRMISAVGGLAAAGTPSHELQEAFSEEWSKNCTSATPACFFQKARRPFLSPCGTCSTVILVPCSLHSSISSSSSLLWWLREWGKTVSSGQMLLSYWDLFIAVRVEFLFDATVDGCVKSFCGYGGRQKGIDSPCSSLPPEFWETTPGNQWEIFYSFL